MTPIITRSLAVLSLGLTLTACTQHEAPKANCFNFRQTQPQAGEAATRLSTKGVEVADRGKACEFVLPGTDD